MSIKPIKFENGVCRMIDQRLLPAQEVWLDYRDYQSVAEAIQTMVVRGAPAIGVAAAFGASFAAAEIEADDFAAFEPQYQACCDVLAATRPTAVNLFWALDRMKSVARANQQLPLAELRQVLLDEALTIAEEDDQINRTMGAHGQVLFPQKANILTHCKKRKGVKSAVD